MDATGRMQPQQEAPTCAFLHNNCEFSLINYDTAPTRSSNDLTFQLSLSRTRSTWFIRRENGKRRPGRDTKWIAAVSLFEYRGNDGVKGATFWNCFDVGEIAVYRHWNLLPRIVARQTRPKTVLNTVLYSSKEKYFLREINPTFHSRIREMVLPVAYMKGTIPLRKKYIRNFAPRAEELCLHFCSRTKQVRT